MVGQVKILYYGGIVEDGMSEGGTSEGGMNEIGTNNVAPDLSNLEPKMLAISNPTYTHPNHLEN